MMTRCSPRTFPRFFDDAAKKFPGTVTKVAIPPPQTTSSAAAVIQPPVRPAGKYKSQKSTPTPAAYKANTPDLGSEIQQLKASGAFILIEASYLPDATLAIKGLKQQDVNFQGILGMDRSFRRRESSSRTSARF